ncbi:MAG: hypothetical protein J6J18_10230, partial [Oscillospiraceae bacterium]|nr:hypothetical protein [Oscillospiraceae bacterium]
GKMPPEGAEEERRYVGCGMQIVEMAQSITFQHLFLVQWITYCIAIPLPTSLALGHLPLGGRYAASPPSA